MTRSWIACSLALGALCIGASTASAQKVKTMGSVVQEPTSTLPAAPAPAPEVEPRSTRPGSNEPRQAPAGGVAPTVTITFASNSADISEPARAELDQLARTIGQQRPPQIELRAFAVGEPAEARRVALARALAVRSYLIDQGVTARIDVGAFNARSDERVEVMVPGP